MLPIKINSIIEGVQIVQVACGESHTIALNSKGGVYGWG